MPGGHDPGAADLHGGQRAIDQAQAGAADDLARGRSKRYGIPIHSNIAGALTLGTGKLAVDGVVIIGAIIVMGKAQNDDYLALILGFLAVILGTLNVVGGFVVTDRMLEMFKKKKK